LSKPRKVKSAPADQVGDLKKQIRDLQSDLDRKTRLDAEDVAIVMWNEVALGANFHAQPYDEKHKLKEMAQAAMDALGFTTGEL
jgi:hypothetical protein